jgi:hypothetical protein
MAKQHICAGFALLLAVAAPAAEIKLGPETPVADLVQVPAPGSVAAVASNGRDFLVVWIDSPRIIVATRVNGDGIPIGQLTLASGESVALTRAGDGYLLAWNGPQGMQIVRLDQSGAPLSSPRALAGNQLLDLVSNGTTHLVVYRDAATHIRATILDDDGVSLHDVALTVDVYAGAGVHDGKYVVADTGPNFGLRIIADDGSVSDQALPRSNVPFRAKATFGRSSILYAWIDSYPAYVVTGYDGTFLKIAQLPSGNTYGDDFVTAEWDGHQFLIVYSRAEAFRVASDGTQIDATAVSISPRNINLLRFASNGTAAIAAWSEYYGSVPSPVARVVRDFDALAAAHDPAPALAQASDDQRNVRIARGARGTFSIWNDFSGTELRGAFNGAPILIDRATGRNEGVSSLSVAAGANTYVVFWRHLREGSDQLLARRFDASGNPIDAQPIVVDTKPKPVPYFDSSQVTATAFDNTAFLLLWQHDQTLMSATLPEAGGLSGSAPLPMPFPISYGVLTAARAIWSGDAFVVAGTFTFPPNIPELPPTQTSLLARVGGANDVVDLERSSSVTLSDVDYGAGAVDAAVAGGRVTYVWNTLNLMAAQRGLDGSVLTAPRVIVPRMLPQYATTPRIVWNGTEYVVAWIELNTPTPARVRAIRLDAHLTPIDFEPFDVSGAVVDVYSDVSLAVTPEGVVIGYARWEGNDSRHPRGYLRTLERAGSQPPHRRSIGR